MRCESSAPSRERNEFETALEYCLEAVRQAGRLAVLHFELGVTYFAMQRSREAYEAYLKAIELDPNLYVAYLNISAIMEQQERFAEARDWALKTLKIKPDYALAHYNLANSYRELGAIDEAIKSYELAHRYRPEHPKTLWNLGICHLLLGNFREGWKLFECRQEAEEVHTGPFHRAALGRLVARRPNDRRSCGARNRRRDSVRLLLPRHHRAGEEGALRADLRSAIGAVVCPVVSRGESLSSCSANGLVAARAAGTDRRADPGRQFAAAFPTVARSVSAAEAVFDGRSELEAMWRDRLAALGGEMKIGISWRAGGKPTERRKRSIPLEQWGELLATPGVRFVNLAIWRRDRRHRAAARARFGVEIHDWEEGDPLVDVDSYVAKIAALDLVISVGNATVHMAGAVGTPAWTLLPTLPSWRWMIAGDVSPWYCGVRLFRQRQRGEWQPVLERIAELLRRVAGSAAEQTAAGLVVEDVDGQMEFAAGRAKPQTSCDADLRNDAQMVEKEEQWLGATDVGRA